MNTSEISNSDPDPLALGTCSVRRSVEGRFQRSGYAALSKVCCNFQSDSGVLHLHGFVPSYYLKQVAQEMVTDIEGVRLINNQIKVVRSPLREAGPEPKVSRESQ